MQAVGLFDKTFELYVAARLIVQIRKALGIVIVQVKAEHVVVINFQIA